MLRDETVIIAVFVPSLVTWFTFILHENRNQLVKHIGLYAREAKFFDEKSYSSVINTAQEELEANNIIYYHQSHHI